MSGGPGKTILIVFGLLFATGNVFSQNTGYFLNSLRLNSGITYLPHSDNEYHQFAEFTWSNQVSVSIAHGLYAGIQVFSINTWGTDVEKENYFLPGAFLHYDFTRKAKAMGFLELSYIRGDYCPCEYANAFRKSNLQYIGAGVGIDYPIPKTNFYISCSILFHRIFGDVPNKPEYNLYKVGLSYRFGKPRYANLP